MEAKDLVLKKINEGNDTRFLLFDHSDGVYAINELLYDILALCQHTSDYALVTEEVNKKHQINYINPIFIDQTLSSTFQKVSIRQQRSSLTDFIGYKITIIREGQFQVVFKYLSVFFQARIIYTLATISLLLSLYFINDNRLFTLTSLYHRTQYNLSPSNIFVVYTVMILVIVFHELGHASASFYYRIIPKEIGFGLYFIFPVFFSNVTNIWQLSRKERNTVNFAGIYFQLIVNIVLILLYYIDFARPIIFTLIITNNASMIGSANPFFRFDGYWIFSDTFNLPNLKFKVRNFLTGLIFEKNSRKAFLAIQSKVLITYTVLSLAFWLFIYFSVFRYSAYNSVRIYRLITTSYWKQGVFPLKDVIVSAFLMVVTMYLILRHFIQTIKVVKNEA